LTSRNLPSFEHLLKDCPAAPWASVLPHETENVCVLCSLVGEAADATSANCQLASSECIIVLVADGLSFDLAKSVLSPPRLIAVTSSCPSTSATALLSATTGLAPASHGVLGVTFYERTMDGVFNCYTDRPASDNFHIGPWPTVFSALSERVDCVAHPGALATTPGRWFRAVVHGSRIIASTVDWLVIANNPAAMASAVIDEVSATLKQRSCRPLLVWAHVNLDSAIHMRGYDSAVGDAVKYLGEAAVQWAQQGCTVIIHSDHGLVETHDSDRARKVLTLLRDRELCRAENGGAGRILWAYPRPGSALIDRVRDVARDFAGVISRDELFAAGAVAATPIARERVGEVVVVATGPEFPMLAPEYRFEHGAFSTTEMMVPVAIWPGR
jgi:hypothetical protein